MSPATGLAVTAFVLAILGIVLALVARRLALKARDAADNRRNSDARSLTQKIIDARGPDVEAIARRVAELQAHEVTYRDATQHVVAVVTNSLGLPGGRPKVLGYIAAVNDERIAGVIRSGLNVKLCLVWLAENTERAAWTRSNDTRTIPLYKFKGE